MPVQGSVRAVVVMDWFVMHYVSVATRYQNRVKTVVLGSVVLMDWSVQISLLASVSGVAVQQNHVTVLVKVPVWMVLSVMHCLSVANNHLSVENYVVEVFLARRVWLVVVILPVVAKRRKWLVKVVQV